MKAMKLINCTPKGTKCLVAACPTIFNATPEAMQCLAGACPTIFKKNGAYIIIGKKLNENELKEFGLEKKVGLDESAIIVEKRLIDEKKKA